MAHGHVRIDTRSSVSATRSAWLVLIVLTLSNALAQSGATLLSAVLPLLKTEFGFSDTQLGLLTGYGSAVAYALLALPVTQSAARWGNAWVLGATMLLCSLANAVTAATSTFWQLLAARFSAGVGPAAAWPLGQALVSAHFPPARRSGAMAVHTAGDFLGGTAPLVLGGWVAAQYGWRTAFLVFAAAGVAIALLQFWLVREAPPVPVEPAVGVTAAPAANWRADVGELLNDRIFLHVMLGFSWASFAVYGLSQWAPSFYNRQFGLSPDKAAAFFGSAYLFGALLGLLAGGWIGNLVGADRKRRLLGFCMVTYLLTFPCVALVLFAPNLQVAFAAHVAATMFGAMPNGPVISLLHNTVAPRLRALASSIFLIALTLLGAGGGPLLIGMLSDALASSQGQGSLRWAMFFVKLLGVMLFVHLILAWRLTAHRDAAPAPVAP